MRCATGPNSRLSQVRMEPYNRLVLISIVVRQQAVLGSRAMARLEQLLEDASSDSYRHRQTERSLLRLIGVVLDNRQPGVPFESDDVVARLCRLLGGTTPIPPGTRTTLIYLVTRVASDACLSTDCRSSEMSDAALSVLLTLCRCSRARRLPTQTSQGSL